jgi:hypothetical protein
MERLLLLCHLMLENLGAARRCHKAKEWWRWIERARAEFWVCLQTNKERVLCREYINK